MGNLIFNGRDQLRLEQLGLSLIFTVSVNFQTVSVLQSIEYSIKFLVIYNFESDSCLVIWELECLELQHPIISIFGIRFLRI